MEHEKKSICDTPNGHAGNGFLAIFGGPQVSCSSENNLKYSKSGRKPKLLTLHFGKRRIVVWQSESSQYRLHETSIRLPPKELIREETLTEVISFMEERLDSEHKLHKAPRL